MKDKYSQLLNKESYNFDDLVNIMALLRSEGGCPWDIEQTHESIRKNLIEETYEAVDAIDRKDIPALREELGDVLMQVVFHARMEEETGSFDIGDVCDEVCKKLIVRHPHVFGDVDADTSDKVLKNWEIIKNQTKGLTSRSETLMAVPSVFPSLMRAQKIQSRAAKAGFDFDGVESALDKLCEEISELKAALTQSKEAVKEEIGDVLFSAVNVSRLCHEDAEEALFFSNEKFISRFKAMEDLANARGIDINESDISVLDSLWDEVKHS